MSPLKESTKRAMRTGYHALLALIAIVPLLMTDLNLGEKATGIVAAVALVAKVVNTLEDAGLIPSWLKGDDTPSPDPV